MQMKVKLFIHDFKIRIDIYSKITESDRRFEYKSCSQKEVKGRWMY